MAATSSFAIPPGSPPILKSTEDVDPPEPSPFWERLLSSSYSDSKTSQSFQAFRFSMVPFSPVTWRLDVFALILRRLCSPNSAGSHLPARPRILDWMFLITEVCGGYHIGHTSHSRACTSLSTSTSPTAATRHQSLHSRQRHGMRTWHMAFSETGEGASCPRSGVDLSSFLLYFENTHFLFPHSAISLLSVHPTHSFIASPTGSSFGFSLFYLLPFFT
jgi:hypothetical protein